MEYFITLKELYNGKTAFRPWDLGLVLLLFISGITKFAGIISKKLQHGNELKVESCRPKKM